MLRLEGGGPIYSIEVGQFTVSKSPLSVLNEAVIPFYFQPPRGWQGGWIKVRIAVSSLASEAKPRWTIVRRYLNKRSVLPERADEGRPPVMS